MYIIGSIALALLLCQFVPTESKIPESFDELDGSRQSDLVMDTGYTNPEDLMLVRYMRSPIGEKRKQNQRFFPFYKGLGK
ncbi:unnamed protein product [Caenorhabditis auriculariae]|uniref:Uncharacterized protein n=1 Tax=Caenorhabditis auriculariae TaxID=2777116 RepID=A0A8S1H8T3_9PELO|nr:unnamed protein product [Caenorhabditis auriculariae]